MPDVAEHVRDPLLDELLRATAPRPTPTARDPLLDELLGKLKRPVRDSLLDEVLGKVAPTPTPLVPPGRDPLMDEVLGRPARDPLLEEVLRGPALPPAAPPPQAPVTSTRQPAPVARPQRAPTEVGPARSIAEILNTPVLPEVRPRGAFAPAIQGAVKGADVVLRGLSALQERFVEPAAGVIAAASQRLGDVVGLPRLRGAFTPRLSSPHEITDRAVIELFVEIGGPVFERLEQTADQGINPGDSSTG